MDRRYVRSRQHSSQRASGSGRFPRSLFSCGYIKERGLPSQNPLRTDPLLQTHSHPLCRIEESHVGHVSHVQPLYVPRPPCHRPRRARADRPLPTGGHHLVRGPGPQRYVVSTPESFSPQAGLSNQPPSYLGTLPPFPVGRSSAKFSSPRAATSQPPPHPSPRSTSPSPPAA